MSPFEVVYGQAPPIHLPYLLGESKVAVVARSLQKRKNMLLLLNFHLMRAQHRMKQMADQHFTERDFDIGDFVYVKLQPYRQQSVVLRRNQKLALGTMALIKSWISVVKLLTSWTYLRALKFIRCFMCHS